MKMVWHGSLPNGERSMDTYCDAWHSGDHLKGGFASNLDGHKLLEQKRQSCDSKLIILCVEALAGSQAQEAGNRRWRQVCTYTCPIDLALAFYYLPILFITSVATSTCAQ